MPSAKDVLSPGRVGVAVWIVLLGATDATKAQDACKVARLTASDASPVDDFGWAVAVRGDTAMVGAVHEDDNGGNAGAVYAFRLDGSTWVETQKLLASDGEGGVPNGDLFGWSIAVDADRALIAALGDDDEGLASGAVYYWRFDGQAWVEEQKLVIPEAGDTYHFGFSLAMRGDVAVIGADFDDDNGANAGAAYVYRFNDQTSKWVQEQKLLASDGAAGDFFGESVGISGDVAVIGSSNHDGMCSGGPASNPGAAYVFRYDPEMLLWIEEQKLVASDCASQDNFGEAIAISQRNVLVAAQGDDDNGSSAGAAYVFRYDPRTATWVEVQKLLASDGQSSDQFGKSVALDGDTAVISAWLDDDVGQSHGAGRP